MSYHGGAPANFEHRIVQHGLKTLVAANRRNPGSCAPGGIAISKVPAAARSRRDDGGLAAWSFIPGLVGASPL